MALAVRPPIAPMLARLTRELPRGDYSYEPKWDGFRCLAFRDGDAVELWSRHDRPLTRYFPEIGEGLLAVPCREFALDGELIPLAAAEGGRFDFASLMGRLHPAASRVERLRHEAPAAYVAFDLLGIGDEDLRDAPFEERRRRLEALLAGSRLPIVLTPLTDDAATAEGWFDRFRGAGIDGVVAKHRALRYEPGKRAMIKVKHERTADCIVAGIRLLPGEQLVSSLILALYDDDNRLRHIGVVTQMPTDMRRELITELAPLRIPLEDHPWREGFIISASPLGRLKGSAARWTPDMEHDWVPLRPERVCEVAFDQVDVDRFRHPARFRRWRPDREPGSCRIDQITIEAPDLDAALRG